MPAPHGETMSSGHRSRPERGSGPTPLVALTAIVCIALGGCASGELAAERDAERRAALDRWSDCIERQSGAAALSEVRARLAHGCEGHRRDVLNAFPPHMTSRLTRLMDERTEVRLRTRLREEEVPRDVGEPLLRHLLETLPTG